MKIGYFIKGGKENWLDHGNLWHDRMWEKTSFVRTLCFCKGGGETDSREAGKCQLKVKRNFSTNSLPLPSDHILQVCRVSVLCRCVKYWNVLEFLTWFFQLTSQTSGSIAILNLTMWPGLFSENWYLLSKTWNWAIIFTI